MNKGDIKRYVFEYADSNMFVMISDNSALVIDPNISQSALKYLRENHISEITVMLTHEHYDHTSGLTWLCGKFKSNVICHTETAVSLQSGKNNRPVMIASQRFKTLPRDEIKKITDNLPQKYTYDPDITFSNKFGFEWHGHEINLISTPGHSKGSCCIEIDDSIVATGDSLIFNTPVVTRFLGSSIEQFENITLPYLKRIKGDTLILPGHGDMFYMKENII